MAILQKQGCSPRVQRLAVRVWELVGFSWALVRLFGLVGITSEPWTKNPKPKALEPSLKGPPISYPYSYSYSHSFYCYCYYYYYCLASLQGYPPGIIQRVLQQLRGRTTPSWKVLLKGMSVLIAQRTQYPLIKEFTLNYRGLNIVI